MAVLPPGKGSQRRPSFRGNILQDTTRGVERTRIWPEPKGSRQTKAQLDQQEWFRQVNWAFKFMAAPVQASFRNATKDTALYPRDLLSMIASGNFVAFKADDERIAYPMAYMQAVSESLDTISQTPGDTLVRGPTFWTPRPITPTTGVLETKVARTTTTGVPSGFTPISWQAAEFDELGIWNPATPTLLTIPAGITRVEAFAGFRTSGGATSLFQAAIRQNTGTRAHISGTTWSTTGGCAISTGPLNVTPGDTIDFAVQFATPGSAAFQPGGTFLSLRFG